MSKLSISYYANVSESSARDLINWVYQQLSQQNANDPYDELIIQISSSGGSSDHGMLLYNFLKQLSIKKTTIGMGNVDSAAVMIFAAGENRLAVPSCRFVLHEARATINGEFNSTKLSELANITKRITQDYVDVISKITRNSKVAIANKVKSGVALSSSEAIKLGLVTGLIEKPYFNQSQNINLFIINNPAAAMQNPLIPTGMPLPQLTLLPMEPGQNPPQVII